MLLTIHNLPPDIDYANIKRIIKELCFINVLLINLQEVDNGSKKVTVSTADANEAAIILRKLNGLEIEGYKLNVELGHDTEKERSPSPSYEEKRRLNTIYNEYIKQIELPQVPSPPRISSPSISTRLDHTSSGFENRRRSHSKSPVRRHKSRSRSPHRRHRSSSRSRGNNSRRLKQSRSRTKSPCDKQISKSSKRHRRSRSPGSRRKRSKSPRARKIRSRSKSRDKDRARSMSRSPPRNKRKFNRRGRRISPSQPSENSDNNLPPKKVIINLTASNDIERESVVSATSEDNNCVIDESIIYAEFNETRILTEETTIARPNNTKSNDAMVRDDFERNTELILNSIMNRPSTSNEGITVLHKTAGNNDPGHRNPYLSKNNSDHDQIINSFEDNNTAIGITPYNRSNSNTKVIVTSNVLYDHKMIASTKEQTKYIPNQTQRNNFTKIPLDQNIVQHNNRFSDDFQSNNYNPNFIDGPFQSRCPTNMEIANNHIVPNMSVARGNFTYSHERPPNNALQQYPDMNNSHNNYGHNRDLFNNVPPQHVMTAVNRNDPRNYYMQAQRNAPPVYNSLMVNKCNTLKGINENNLNRNQFINYPANSNFDDYQGMVGKIRGPFFNYPPPNFMKRPPIPEGKPYHIENTSSMNLTPNPETGLDRNMPILNTIRKPQVQECYRPIRPLLNEAWFRFMRFKNNNITKDVSPSKLGLVKERQNSILPNSSKTPKNNEVTINKTILKPNTAKDQKFHKFVSNTVHNNEDTVKQTAIETKTQNEATIDDKPDREIAQNIQPRRKIPEADVRKEKERNKYDAWKVKQSDYFVNQKDTISSDEEKKYFKTIIDASTKLNHIIIQATPKKHPSLNEYRILTDYIADKLHKLIKNKPNAPDINQYNNIKENLYKKLAKTMNKFLEPLEPIAEEYVSIFLYEYQEETHRGFMEFYYKWCSEVFYLTEEDYDIICEVAEEVTRIPGKKRRCRSINRNKYKKKNTSAKRNRGQKLGGITLERYKRPRKKVAKTTELLTDLQINAETDVLEDKTKTTEPVDILKEIDPQIQLLDQQPSNEYNINSKESTVDTDEAIDTELISKFETDNEKYRTENRAATHAPIFESDNCGSDNIPKDTTSILHDTTLHYDQRDDEETLNSKTDSDQSTTSADTIESDPGEDLNQLEKTGPANIMEKSSKEEYAPVHYDSRNEKRLIDIQMRILKAQAEGTEGLMKKKKKNRKRSKVKKWKPRSGLPRNRGIKIGSISLQNYVRKSRTSIDSLIEETHTNEDKALEDADTPNQQQLVAQCPETQENTVNLNSPIEIAIERLDEQITEVRNDTFEQLENLHQNECVKEKGNAETSHESQERNVEKNLLYNHPKRQESQIIESMDTDIREELANTKETNNISKIINPKIPVLDQENMSNHQIENTIKNSSNILVNTPNIDIDTMDTNKKRKRKKNKAPTSLTANNSVPKSDTNIPLNIETISSDKTLNNPTLDQPMTSDVSINSEQLLSQLKQSKHEEEELKTELKHNNSETIKKEMSIDKVNKTEQQKTELQLNKISDTNKTVANVADRIVYSEETISVDVIPDDEIKTEIIDETIDQQDAFRHPDWPIKIETEEYVETFYQLQASDSVQMPKPLSE